MSTHLYTYENPCSEKDLQRVIKILNNDGVIAYPTDLSWAFGCRASSARAIDRIKALKPSKSLPFSLIFDSISRASQYTVIDHAAYRILKRALPGPYTMILPSHKQLPRQLGDKRKTVGIRIPERPLLIELVCRLEEPLLTTSLPDAASGPCLYGYEVFDRFGHALDLICDLGSEMSAGETTILDLSSGLVELIRQGMGSVEGIIAET